MRVLITGASGFVGQNVVKYIKAHTDWEIVSEYPADWVINLASNSSVEESIKYPQDFIEENLHSTIYMLEQARKHPVKKFIQFSTVEAHSVANPYAASKAAQEAVAKAYKRTYGVPVTILRSGNIVGPEQKPDKFVPKLIEKITNNEVVPIYMVDGKPGLRYYNAVDNVADALIYTLENDLSKTTYTIPGGELQSNLAMADLVARKLGKEYKWEPVDGRLGYSYYLPAGGELGNWTPPYTLEESMSWISK